MDYIAPVDEIMEALQTVGIDELLAQPAFADIDVDAVRAVVEGFGSLAAEVIAPTDRIGDRVGAIFDPATGDVATAPELAHAFEQFRKGGWTAVSAAPEAGGGGFPGVVATAVREMFGSANMALSLNPVLTQSAIELLERWGDERQQSLYLARLIDGTWTGTMNLTEPDAGSDLGAVRTSARPLDDGRWAISGTKIYITWGEHDLTDNILHLVLARTPGAPSGTKGISLFLVPKRLVHDDGTLHERNGVHATSIEHKMGIHASPTCVLQFDDAIGELVGPLHGGMPAMFSMMNPARVAIGAQGVSIAERSFQQAVSFAAERRQGSAGGVSPVPIIRHPDVQRMLVDIAVSARATRLLVYATSAAADAARHHADASVRERAERRADLLTPLAKAYSTDEGVRVASLAVQVHGGMGFVEETGIAQRYRDARIAPIYEGTNGIQSIDLLGRKVVRDGGVVLGALLDEIVANVSGISHDDLADCAAEVLDAVEAVRSATNWMIEAFADDRDSALAGATGYLRLVALTVCAELLTRQAAAAYDAGSPEAERWGAQARFFVAEHLAAAPRPQAITFGARDLRRALGRDDSSASGSESTLAN